MRDATAFEATDLVPSGFVAGTFGVVSSRPAAGPAFAVGLTGSATDAPPTTVRAAVRQSFVPSVLAAAPELTVAVREAARAAGFAAGFAAGARQAAEVAAAEATRVAAARAAQEATAGALIGRALDVLERAAAAAAARTAPVLADAEQMLHAGAFELAQAVLGLELTDHDQSARAALARVLNQPRLPEPVTVHLSPRDLDTLHSAGVPELPDGVALVADASLAPGDALAVHPDGYLDARIGSALDRARTALSPETVDL